MKKILLLVAILLSTLDSSYSLSKRAKQAIDAIKEIDDIIEERYINDIDHKVYLDNLLYGSFEALDDNSAYINKSQYKDISDWLLGSFGGIGVDIKNSDMGLEVKHSHPEFSAYKAGIRNGDIVTKIDGISIVNKDISDAVNLIRGKIGTYVDITYTRKGKEYTKKVERIEVSPPTVTSDITNNIIKIKIRDFNEKTIPLFEDAMNRYKYIINLKGIIIDLRDNGGGLLDQSVELSSLFLPLGKKIIDIKGKSKTDNQSYLSNRDNLEYKFLKEVPLVLIVNGESASASEIFAAAIKDNKRGVVIGQKTYGKGSIQEIIPLNSIKDAGIKITTAKYYTPHGICIDKIGISPNVLVKNNMNPLNIAISLINNKKSYELVLSK
jgi:carboxyl-terminal processing protease